MRLMYYNSALPVDSHPTVLGAESQDPGSQGQLSHPEGPGGGRDFWQPHSKLHRLLPDLTPHFGKDFSRIGLGPSLMTRFQLWTSAKTLSPNKSPSEELGLGLLKHLFGGTQFHP